MPTQSSTITDPLYYITGSYLDGALGFSCLHTPLIAAALLPTAAACAIGAVIVTLVKQPIPTATLIPEPSSLNSYATNPDYLPTHPFPF